MAQLVKNPPAMWETWVQSLGWEDPLEKEKATHSNILAWRIPWGHKESDTSESLSLSLFTEMEPRSPTLQADSLPAEPQGKPRILERVAYPFSSRSSQPRNWTRVSCIAGGFFTSWATREAKNTGVGSLSLLQRIFPTQGPNRGLLLCRQSLHQLNYQGSPYGRM